MSHPAEQQTQARQSACQTGRHKAPTGAPASTDVRVGGEGTPSREVLARAAGRPTLGSTVVALVVAAVALVLHYTPSLYVRTLWASGGAWVSLEINHEGIFLFIAPVELALLWPGVEA